MLSFLWENQGNWSCRCPIGSGDPPVYSDAAGICEDEAQGFVEVCDSLDLFLATFCLQEVVLGCINVFSAERNATYDGIAGLKPLWLNGKYVFDEPTHSFFGGNGPGLLILSHANGGIMLASPSTSDPLEIHRMTGLKVSRLD